MLLATLCKGLVRDGALTLIDADGTTHRLGPSSRGAGLVVRLHRRGLGGDLASGAPVSLRRAYADGTLTVERGTIADLLELCARNAERAGARSAGVRALVRGLEVVVRGRATNPRPFEIPYAEILDYERERSCALFADPGMTLEEAEERKKHQVLHKLLLRPGQSVLEIESAWGGLALHLAELGGVDVTGIASSHEEVAVARRRAAEARLASRVSFHPRELRAEASRYDRIVSVGALARLGSERPVPFARISDLLAEDGVAVIDAVGRADGAATPASWLPGATFAPTLGELVASAERERLRVTDVEVLRYHPAETLRCWRQRLVASWERLVEAHGPRACRAWEFDLALGEAAFRHRGLVVYELQVAKRLDAVPLTRDYLYDVAPGTRRSMGAPSPGGPSGNAWSSGAEATQGTGAGRRVSGRERRAPPFAIA